MTRQHWWALYFGAIFIAIGVESMPHFIGQLSSMMLAGALMGFAAARLWPPHTQGGS